VRAAAKQQLRWNCPNAVAGRVQGRQRSRIACAAMMFAAALKPTAAANLKQQIMATGTEGADSCRRRRRGPGSQALMSMSVPVHHTATSEWQPRLNLPSIRVDFHVQNLKQLLTDSDRLVVGRHVPLRTRTVLCVRKRRMVLPRQA
jgi:hypothetical protein